MTEGENKDIDTSDFKHAGFYSRYLAFRIDAIVIGIFITLPILFLSLVHLDETYQMIIGVVVALFIPQILYYPIFEAKWNTAGKSFAGIKVVDRNGDQITFKQAFIRNLEKLIWVIPVIGQIYAYLSSQAIKWDDQRFGDGWADTYVIKVEKIRREQYRPRRSNY